MLKPATQTSVSALDALAITLSDTADQNPTPFRGFMVTTAGNVAIETPSGNQVVIPACQPGTVYPICVKRFRITNTSATGLVGLI